MNRLTFGLTAEEQETLTVLLEKLLNNTLN